MPEKADIQVILSEMVRRMNEHSRRLRALENRIALIENRISTIEDTTIRINAELRERFEKIEKKTKDMDTVFLKIGNDINKLNKNMERVAKKSELKEIENYISLISPFKTEFVTRSEVKKMMEEIK